MLQIRLSADTEFAVTAQSELRAQRLEARKHLDWPKRPKPDLPD